MQTCENNCDPLTDRDPTGGHLLYCKYYRTQVSAFRWPYHRVIETPSTHRSHPPASSVSSHDVKPIHPVHARPEVYGKIDLRMVLTVNILPGPNLRALTKRNKIATPVRWHSHEDLGKRKHFVERHENPQIFKASSHNLCTILEVRTEQLVGVGHSMAPFREFQGPRCTERQR